MKQYTIRNVPGHIDNALRQRAKETNKSFNQVVLEALAVGAGSRVKRDLSEIAGSISQVEADALDNEIRSQRQVDAEMWS